MTVHIDGSIGVDLVQDGTITPAKLTQKLTLGTPQLTTSGITKDFLSIPNWVKRITVQLAGVSKAGTSAHLIRLGTSGGLVTTGYIGGVGFMVNGSPTIVTNYTNGFGINSGGSNIYSGNLSLTLLNSATNQWTASGTFSDTSSSTALTVSGAITLPGVLDRVSLLTANGTDVFTAGAVNILYEG